MNSLCYGGDSHHISDTSYQANYQYLQIHRASVGAIKAYGSNQLSSCLAYLAKSVLVYPFLALSYLNDVCAHQLRVL